MATAAGSRVCVAATAASLASADTLYAIVGREEDPGIIDKFGCGTR